MRRHSLGLCGLLVALVLLCHPASMAAQPASTALAADYMPNEVIVRLAPTLDISTLLATLGLSRSLALIDRLGTLPIYRLRILNGASPLDMATLLMRVPLVVYAEPNFLGQSPEGVARSSWARGDQEEYHEQWAPTVLRLPEAHSATRGAGVTVAVLDTGADLNHPSLAGHLVPGIDFVGGDLDPSEEGVYGQDLAFGHGTHVAGLVALAAPEAKIMPVRILKPDGSGESWLLAQAIRYVLERQVRVLNISYSTQRRSLLVEDLLSLAASVGPGALVVAAAGNSGPSTAREYPAAESTRGLLAVAASTEQDQLADFSTRGPWVDVAAPGQYILSSVPDDAYGTWSGTSMATPLVAGTAALVLSASPQLTAEQVAQRIIATAAPIEGAVPHRVDAAAAVGLAGAQP